MHGREFGQLLEKVSCNWDRIFCISYLSLPVGENTKSLNVAELVKIRVVAALEFTLYRAINGKASLVPKTRVGTRSVVRIPEIEIHIPAVGLPLNLMFFDRERCGSVQIPIEANQVAHSGHGVVHHYVHAAFVNLRDSIPPVLNIAKVMILVVSLMWIRVDPTKTEAHQ